MTKDLFSRRSLSLSGVIAVLISGLAASPALADQGGKVWCSPPQLSQPFASANDFNWYMLAPGQTPDNFNGSGWKLSGGAKIVTTQLADGQTGQVLDLPSGSAAVSPTFCIRANFESARGIAKDVAGSDRVGVYVANNREGTTSTPKYTGTLDGGSGAWALSDPVNVAPSSDAGQQQVQFTFVAGVNRSDVQVYDFYVDPRMSG
jgi:hypothetical protein